MAKLDDLIKRYKRDALSTAKLAAADLSNRVIRRTPVDQGSLRASWTPNINTPHAVNININDDAPMPDRHNHSAVINHMQQGDEYYLCNGQPYARRIEYEGHSGQAPSGMLRVSCAEWQQIVNRAAKRGN